MPQKSEGLIDTTTDRNLNQGDAYDAGDRVWKPEWSKTRDEMSW